ncbi:hypothetical protein B0H19DRAFT_1062744 [Mycena capillaripes]|nr:hypothetical protein B0H19DRAFT_1062744 [Mycena capillaripes]
MRSWYQKSQKSREYRSINAAEENITRCGTDSDVAEGSGVECVNHPCASGLFGGARRGVTGEVCEDSNVPKNVILREREGAEKGGRRAQGSRSGIAQVFRERQDRWNLTSKDWDGGWKLERIGESELNNRNQRKHISSACTGALTWSRFVEEMQISMKYAGCHSESKQVVASTRGDEAKEQ